MAKFKITKTTTVAQLKAQFGKEVGGTLRVYEGRSEAPEDAKLVSLGANVGDLECRTSRTVGKFEEAFQDQLNLKVKVYTKDNWVKVLDGITLATAAELPNGMTKAKMEEYLSYKRDEKEAVTEEVEIPDEIKGIPLFDIHMKKVEWPFTTEKDIDKHSDELGAFGVVEVVGMEFEDGDVEKYISTGDTDDSMYNAVEFIERCRSRYDYEIFKAWISDSIKIYGLDKETWRFTKDIGQALSSFGGADYIYYEWNLGTSALFRVQYDDEEPNVFSIDVDGEFDTPYDNKVFEKLIELKEDGLNKEVPETFNPEDYYFNESGLAWFRNKDYKYGFIDRKGKIVIDCIYDDAENFTEGLASVKKDGKYGFIDPKGNVIIDFIYDKAAYFSDGLARVKKDNKYGFIDRKGNLVIDYIYDFAQGFSEGLASVEKNGKWGFIDRKGNVIIDFIYDFTGCFEDGLAEAEKDGNTIWIDKNGNAVEKDDDEDCEEE